MGFEPMRPKPTDVPGLRNKPLCELSIVGWQLIHYPCTHGPGSASSGAINPETTTEENMGFEPMRPQPTDLANQRNKPLCEFSIDRECSAVELPLRYHDLRGPEFNRSLNPWCARRDLNPHDLSRHLLKVLRLPFHHSRKSSQGF